MTGELTAPFVRTHNCLDHLTMRGGYDVQPHGESHYETWNQCAICDEVYSDKEVEQMWAEEPVDDREDEAYDTMRAWEDRGVQ